MAGRSQGCELAGLLTLWLVGWIFLISRFGISGSSCRDLFPDVGPLDLSPAVFVSVRWIYLGLPWALFSGVSRFEQK